jgi:hypothetical protein
MLISQISKQEETGFVKKSGALFPYFDQFSVSAGMARS